MHFSTQFDKQLWLLCFPTLIFVQYYMLFGEFCRIWRSIVEQGKWVLLYKTDKKFYLVNVTG